MTICHATCVAKSGAGALLRGDSGAGKSDLALRLMAAGWRLVADDQVVLTPVGNVLVATPPPRLAGLLEVRGSGITRVAHAVSAPVMLVVDLVSAGTAERMPAPDTCALCNQHRPRIEVDPFETAATEKIVLALDSAKCWRIDHPNVVTEMINGQR